MAKKPKDTMLRKSDPNFDRLLVQRQQRLNQWGMVKRQLHGLLHVRQDVDAEADDAALKAEIDAFIKRVEDGELHI